MSTHDVCITYRGIDEWSQSERKVNEILEADTGQSQYISTKSLPPITIVPQLNDETIEKIRALDGVEVRIQDGNA
ncbi:hypothetical protein FSARC_9836 [Fusarium sarcochroum]|uniref:Uncharacterized protein n=1 Tax=Fusarium sarcochroum TaxID=1208366 RepID=A0A8H4TQ41_9HYPO|nr:hypothetical protein FSARC_9836 [Fusarium sarcochroum]